jgi:phosphopantothenoylcysteine decarboxylase/phosphopantothenate--cysteine ligase
MTLELEKTLDILSSLGKAKIQQFLVGFALETQNEAANAKGKLEAKNCDMIVLNSLRNSGAGFGHDTNQVTLIERNKSRTFELKSKEAVADDILKAIMIKIL